LKGALLHFLSVALLYPLRILFMFPAFIYAGISKVHMQFLLPTRSADITLQRIGPEAILYDQRHGRAHVLNASATRIWELCDGHATLDDIVSTVAAAYSMPPAAVHDDVVSIVSTFRALGVLD
jgi:hypothetical protein